MNIEQFIETVRQMRTAQKAYFKESRKQSDLIKSKQLEKLVDDALAAGFEAKDPAVPETEQPTLFE